MKMPQENVIELEEIKAYMMFTIVFDNEQTEEVNLEVGCAEDIEEQMKMFIKEDWENLFSDWYDPFNFMYAHFNGIYFGNNGRNKISMQIYGNYKRGNCTLDYETLADENAKKLLQIRTIANS
jgi:trans-2-enoyl-CoA reductase